MVESPPTPRPSSGPSPAAAERFGAALVEIESELNWKLLGRAYCEDGGDDFFGEEQREAQRDAALRFAADVVERLSASPTGASLYIGAGIAEIAPILAETLLVGRAVTVVSLDGPETRELNRALAAVEARLGVSLPRWSTQPLVRLETIGFDHLWLVSVLTDPEAFPALHDMLYERGRPKRRALDIEAGMALGLVDAALRRIKTPTLVHTTSEESGLLADACHNAGMHVVLAREGRLSPIVGDVVRHGRILLGAPKEAPKEA
ncbi:hypothetical protein [Engelhardtia mirabilis]|uniref:Uncharacterized protein n=1 Tax=Engelhardtia mirabilis TaxID=2528011 RepID=A0A518BM00_9BACT|nr:hypothetical protein Pla133_30990 [Planctomycetes bacterium Pla133]QDV02334.1 hypothetical protein Pla86_30980 [Planctomycetes bacterium Pla86]